MKIPYKGKNSIFILETVIFVWPTKNNRIYTMGMIVKEAYKEMKENREQKRWPLCKRR